MIHHSSNTISNSNIKKVIKTLESGMLSSGNSCDIFKEKLKEYFNCKDVYLTNSGSSAIYLALKALKTNKTEIIFPSYVCKDVLEAVVLSGFKPVLCDISDHWNVSYKTIKKKVTKNTAAIIVPHNLGICVDVIELKELGVTIIEDCCQSIGGYFNKSLSGTMGDITVLSFNATKCFTTGEGGAVLVNTKKGVSNLKKLNSLEHIFRMSDLQASLGVSQMAEYEGFLESRKRIANSYFNNINHDLTRKFGECRANSMFFRFLLFNSVDFLKAQAYFKKRNIAVRKGIDSLLHRQYKLGKDKEFENSVFFFNQTLSIPIYPSLKIEQANHISKTVNGYFNGY